MNIKFSTTLLLALIFFLSCESSFSGQKREREDGSPKVDFERVAFESSNQVKGSLEVKKQKNEGLTLIQAGPSLNQTDQSLVQTEKLPIRPLPFDVVKKILQQLNIYDFIRASGVCVDWRKVALERFSLTQNDLIKMLTVEEFLISKDKNGNIGCGFLDVFLKDKRGFETLRKMLDSCFLNVLSYQRQSSNPPAPWRQPSWGTDELKAKARVTHPVINYFHPDSQISEANVKTFALLRLFAESNGRDETKFLKSFTINPQLFMAYAPAVMSNLWHLYSVHARTSLDLCPAQEHFLSLRHKYANTLESTLPREEMLEVRGAPVTDEMRAKSENDLRTVRRVMKYKGKEVNSSSFNCSVVGIVFHNAAACATDPQTKRAFLIESAFSYENWLLSVHVDRPDHIIRGDFRMLADKFFALAKLTKEDKEKHPFLLKAKRYVSELAHMPVANIQTTKEEKTKKEIKKELKLKQKEENRLEAAIDEALADCSRNLEKPVEVEKPMGPENLLRAGKDCLANAEKCDDPKKKYDLFKRAGEFFRQAIVQKKNATTTDYVLAAEAYLKASNIALSRENVNGRISKEGLLDTCTAITFFGSINQSLFTPQMREMFGHAWINKAEATPNKEDKQDAYRRAIWSFEQVEPFTLGWEKRLMRIALAKSNLAAITEDEVVRNQLVRGSAEAFAKMPLSMIEDAAPCDLWFYEKAAKSFPLELKWLLCKKYVADFDSITPTCQNSLRKAAGLCDELLSVEQFQTNTIYLTAARIQLRIFQFMTSNAVHNYPGTRLECCTRYLNYMIQAFERFPDKRVLQDYTDVIAAYLHLAKCTEDTSKANTISSLEEGAQWVEKALTFLKNSPQQKAEIVDSFYKQVAFAFNALLKLEKDPQKKELIIQSIAKLNAAYLVLENKNQDEDKG
jgi:hypothetical protein